MGLQWTSGAASHTGTVRPLNEDRCLTLDDAGVWCVADGMGGHQLGDYASQRVVDELSQASYQALEPSVVDQVRDGVQRAHEALSAMGSDQGGLVGTTVAILIAQNNHAVCWHAGDSRVYLLRDAELRQITVDHTFVEELVRAGQITREESRTHRSAHLLSRAVGQDEPLELERTEIELKDGDRFLLCSDGVYNVLSQDVMQTVLASTNAAHAPTLLIETALRERCPDNLTAVVIEFQS